MDFAQFKILETGYKYIIKIVNLLRRLFSKRRRKKFLERIWKPYLVSINKGVVEFYSKEALDDLPEYSPSVRDIEHTEELFGEKIHFYVPSKEISTPSLSLGYVRNMAQIVRTSRTKSISAHLDHGLRNAVENIAEREIVYDVMKESIPSVEKNISEKTDERMIEDLFYDGKLKQIFVKVKNQYGGRKADYRTKDHVRALFIEEYSKFLNKDGGILQKLSQRQFKYLKKGLTSWFIPKSKARQLPRKLHDWKIFFLNQDLEVLIVARVTKLKAGQFNELIRKFGYSTKIDGMSRDESKKIIEDWVKGIGGVKSKKGIKPTGRAVDVIHIKFTDLVNTVNQIVPDVEFKSNTCMISFQESRKYYSDCLKLE